jgi:hypothetical protein
MSNSFFARISILDSAGNSIWLSVKREVKTINTFLILCNDVTICDTKRSASSKRRLPNYNVLDTQMYERFNKTPSTEVNDYLFELKAYGLIEVFPKDTGENYGLMKITKKGCSYCTISV